MDKKHPSLVGEKLRRGYQKWGDIEREKARGGERKQKEEDHRDDKRLLLLKRAGKTEKKEHMRLERRRREASFRKINQRGGNFNRTQSRLGQSLSVN